MCACARALARPFAHCVHVSHTYTFVPLLFSEEYQWKCIPHVLNICRVVFGGERDLRPTHDEIQNGRV